MTDVIEKSFNDDCELYFIIIQMDKESAHEFLVSLWAYASPKLALNLSIMNGSGPFAEHYDSFNGFRTKYTEVNELVYIRNHAWHHSQDFRPLPDSVLEFLESRGYH